MEGIPRPPHPIVRGGRIARPDRVDAGPLSIKGPCQAAAVLSLPGSRRGGGIHFDIPPPQPPTRARPRPPPRGGEDPPPPWPIRLWARGSVHRLRPCLARFHHLAGLLLSSSYPFSTTSASRGAPIAGGVGADVRQPPGPPPSPSPSHTPPMTATCSFFCSDPKPSSAAASDRRPALPCPPLRVSTRASTRALAAQRRQGERRPSRHAACFLAPQPAADAVRAVTPPLVRVPTHAEGGAASDGRGRVAATKTPTCPSPTARFDARLVPAAPTVPPSALTCLPLPRV